MQDNDKPARNRNEELQALVQKVLDVRGFDLGEYNMKKLRDSVQERLAANNLSSLEKYMELMDRQPDEYDRLFNSLLPNRYDLFFDPEVMEFLKEKIIPQIIEYKKKAALSGYGAQPVQKDLSPTLSGCSLPRSWVTPFMITI